jgi:UDP-N-acetylmuramyl pentapeptide phosphotransferase/UDP-N-acetylglucosamine-1-phosphate transferase
MFIGDSGTLVVGTMMSMFVISILYANLSSTSMMLKGVGLIPFTIAVLSIPVFDTVRVMSTRILHKKSPFNPDKTHLHHMFIDLGFSHIRTTISILCLNFIIIASWFVAYKLGASIETQLYIVLALGVIFTFGFYNFSKRQIEKNGKFLRFLQSIGKCMNFEKKGIWSIIQKSIDKL